MHWAGQLRKCCLHHELSCAARDDDFPFLILDSSCWYEFGCVFFLSAVSTHHQGKLSRPMERGCKRQGQETCFLSMQAHTYIHGRWRLLFGFLRRSLFAGR